MIRATREGVMAANPGKRPFVLSRANFLGGQRYGATWTGDNSATWEHLDMSIPMTVNLGLSANNLSNGVKKESLSRNVGRLRNVVTLVIVFLLFCLLFSQTLTSSFERH
jgi:hypothetical protein